MFDDPDISDPARVRWSEELLRRRLASNVRSLREQRGISQEKAAELAEISPRKWQQVEAGEHNATLRTLLGLAIALEVDPADLIS